MLLKGYGVELKTMQAGDLELVRQWRNAPHVREFMHHKAEISRDEQQNWFKQLDKNHNHYFVLYSHTKPLGVLNIKEIDKHSLSGEAGIFIGSLDALNSPVPVAATLLLMSYAFEDLKLRCLKAKIHEKNSKAINFNLALGYEKTPGDAVEGFGYYHVTKERFYEATKQLRATLEKF